MQSDWLPRISTSCRGCGEVHLAPQDLTLALPLWDPGEEWAYRFECPVCGGMVSRRLSDRDLDLLASIGVEVDFGLDGPLPDLPESPGPQERSS